MDTTLNEMNFQCIQCGFHIKKLYIQYSPGNIRLMKCNNCKAVADEYIECEIMGLLWRLTLGFLLLDAYRIFISSSSEDEWRLSMTFASLVWSCGKMLMDAFLGNFMFLVILLLGTRVLLNASVGISGFKYILLAILVSSYLKIFLFAMMVWEFPSSVLFIVDIFVLSSNTVALKVITESAVTKCLGACFSAHAVKFLVSLVLKKIHPSDLIL